MKTQPHKTSEFISYLRDLIATEIELENSDPDEFTDEETGQSPFWMNAQIGACQEGGQTSLIVDQESGDSFRITITRLA